ncbi:hypothetical protein JW964_05390 [candidate division KSB1 bacterium]|nr:hypothetical protein [candidate division KSB1 bacterium]
MITPTNKWETYEEVARFVLNKIKDRFGIDFFEGKQEVNGKRSGTSYEIDAKGIKENDETFIIVECRRYTTSKQNQEKLGTLAYRIIDSGAGGGIIVSPLGLQLGAIKIANAENIVSVTLDPGSTFEHYAIKLINELIIRPAPATARESTKGPIIVISESNQSK